MTDDMNSDPNLSPLKEIDKNTQMHARLQSLKREHRQLDLEISALQEAGTSDMLKLARMKKLKLNLKDTIKCLEDQLNPDIIA